MLSLPLVKVTLAVDREVLVHSALLVVGGHLSTALAVHPTLTLKAEEPPRGTRHQGLQTPTQRAEKHPHGMRLQERRIPTLMVDELRLGMPIQGPQILTPLGQMLVLVLVQGGAELHLGEQQEDGVARRQAETLMQEQEVVGEVQLIVGQILLDLLGGSVSSCSSLILRSDSVSSLNYQSAPTPAAAATPGLIGQTPAGYGAPTPASHTPAWYDGGASSMPPATPAAAPSWSMTIGGPSNDGDSSSLPFPQRN